MVGSLVIISKFCTLLTTIFGDKQLRSLFHDFVIFVAHKTNLTLTLDFSTGY